MKRVRYIAERKKRGLSGKQIRNRAGMAAAVLFAAVMAGGCATPAQFPDTIKVQDVNDSEGITVTGKEEVKVVPDMTEIRYGVYSQAQTASQCQEDNAKQLDQTIETLKGLGVEETSIQTSAYGLSPIYDWNSGNRTITGYEMNTEITAVSYTHLRKETEREVRQRSCIRSGLQRNRRGGNQGCRGHERRRCGSSSEYPFPRR